MALACGLCPLSAQALHSAPPGPGIVPLSVPWRFHPGDDPHWADPHFNDAAWPLLQPDAGWSTQGYPSYTGYAWYRLHLDVRSEENNTSALALYLPAVDDNFQLFLDGFPLGTFGGFPPQARLANATPGTIVPLSHNTGVLAIRVWKAQLASTDGADLGGFEAAPVLGTIAMLSLLRDQVIAIHDHTLVTREMLSSVLLVAGLVCLVLFLRGKRDPVLLWVAVYLLADAGSALLSTLFWYHFTLGGMQALNALRVVLCNISLWLALLHLFGMADSVFWQRLTRVFAAAMIASEWVDTILLFFWQFTHPALPWVDGILTAIYTLLPAYLFALLYAGLRRNPRINFWPLALGVSAYGLYNLVVDTTLQGRRFTGIHLAQTLDSWTVSLAGYPVGARTCLDAAFVFALLYTVARQQASESARRAALELELKSAQEIQQLLIPATLPEVPGFALAALYRPASEVGGDFFQLLPTTSAGLLLIIGDVSGKGLKAAMTVSLIVGAIRTLAELSDSPAALLAGLNRRLVGRTGGGFATCLALRIDHNGEAVLANAGHLAPFLGSSELPLEGSVPLGLVEDLQYTEVGFHFSRHTQLTLYTDGLLEARNKRGELFGFSRVSDLLSLQPSVQSIMEEALRFGQEDDITLLTVSHSSTRELPGQL